MRGAECRVGKGLLLHTAFLLYVANSMFVFVLIIQVADVVEALVTSARRTTERSPSQRQQRSRHPVNPLRDSQPRCDKGWGNLGALTGEMSADLEASIEISGEGLPFPARVRSRWRSGAVLAGPGLRHGLLRSWRRATPPGAACHRPGAASPCRGLRQSQGTTATPSERRIPPGTGEERRDVLRLEWL